MLDMFVYHRGGYNVQTNGGTVYSGSNRVDSTNTEPLGAIVCHVQSDTFVVFLGQLVVVL